MVFLFLDQNIMEKMSKKGHQAFQNNVNKVSQEEKGYEGQLLTPFSLLEFSGCNPKYISDITYKNVNFTEFLFLSYKDCNNEDMAKDLKNEICKKITKGFLKETLENKKIREKNHLNKEGFRFIDLYIAKIDPFYNEIINYLCLEQISQINTSRFSKEDRCKYIGLLSRLVIDFACRKISFGSFRAVLKLHEELKKQPIPQKIKENPELFKMVKEIPNIIQQSKLKSKGDRVDCEIIHLALFGHENKSCHIYTSDNKKLITHRLYFYHVFMKFIIEYFQPKENRKNSSNNYKPPKWNYGKVFILNRETGEKIATISVKEKVQDYLSLS